MNLEISQFSIGEKNPYGQYSILMVRVTCMRCQRNRCRFSMLHLNRPAAIFGIFIMRKRAAGRSF